MPDPKSAKLEVCEPDEIVPHALRGFLRWDDRHDRESRRIMAEFNLKLPDNRELIRQLAFVRVQQRG
jgi:hypothetical protein